MRKILIAIVIGLLLGYISTTYHTEGPCTETIPGEDNSHCVSLTREYASLDDIIHNKQNRSVEFIKGFAVGSLISFAILNVPLRSKKHSVKGEV